MKKKEYVLSILLCLLVICMIYYLENIFPALRLTRRWMLQSAALQESDMQQSEEFYLPKEEIAFTEPPWAMSETYVEMEFTINENGIAFSFPCQSPCFTTGEINRAKNLLMAYELGDVTNDGESILNKKDNVDLAAYQLNATDWDGERMYTLLPCTCLTDTQILAIIDAFHQCGLRFDPEELNYRNCSRGGGSTMTRSYTEDETNRFNTIKASLLNDCDTTEPVRFVWTVCAENIELIPEFFCGVNQFELVPYRCLTNEEITAKLVLNRE